MIFSPNFIFHFFAQKSLKTASFANLPIFGRNLEHSKTIKMKNRRFFARGQQKMKNFAIFRLNVDVFNASEKFKVFYRGKYSSPCPPADAHAAGVCCRWYLRSDRDIGFGILYQASKGAEVTELQPVTWTYCSKHAVFDNLICEEAGTCKYMYMCMYMYMTIHEWSMTS